MFIVRQDHVTRQWGYEILTLLSKGGPVGGHRVLESSFEGFEAPNEVLAFYESLKKALTSVPPTYKLARNEEGMTGYRIYELNPAGLWQILTENFGGWENADEVRELLKEMADALGEMKMINNAPPVKSSKKAVSVEEAKKFNPNFEVDDVEEW